MRCSLCVSETTHCALIKFKVSLFWGLVFMYFFNALYDYANSHPLYRVAPLCTVYALVTTSYDVYGHNIIFVDIGLF